MKKTIKALLLITLLALFVGGCSTTKASDKVITVGASPTPHAKILEAARAALLADGYTLVIKEFTDYVLPNTALNSGDLDANYFQHVPYLTDFNTKNGTKLSSVLAVHFEPLGLYPGKTTSLAALKDGATIAVPNDKSNETRALALLQDNGLITVNPAKLASEDATILDITSNPRNFKFTELEAVQIPRALADVDLAVINGNYALEAKIEKSVLLTESKDSAAAKKYANILVVQTGKETTAKTKELIKVLGSQAIKDFIKANFYPTVIPA